MRRTVFLSSPALLLGLLACNNSDGQKPSAQESSAKGSATGSAHQGGLHVQPPFSLTDPPADAIKTASGLIYKKVTTNADGTAIHRNDTVLINYTGWNQKSGETFFTNRDRAQPLPLNLAKAAPGFVEALQVLHKGESAVFWMPASIGFKTPPPKPETRVYQIEVVDLVAAPEIPDDVGKPPETATKLASGTKKVVLKPGTGPTARTADSVTYEYTAWDHEGRMLDSSTNNHKPASGPPYKLSAGMGELLMSMAAGERARFWVDAALTAVNGKTVPGAEGTLCYDVEVQQITKAAHEPPPTPPDVAKPPADAKKTAKGVYYRLLKAGPGTDPRHPQPSDTVRVHYTGWTTDGRMFDSSVLRGEQSVFNLHSVVAGWTDGIPLMTIGQSMRFWIPEELAYKGQPGKPQGMLVFDVELFEIVPPTSH